MLDRMALQHAPYYYLGHDPGPVSGLAFAGPAGELLGYDQVEQDGLAEYLESLPSIVHVVGEEYIPRGGRFGAIAGKPVITIKAIGVMDSFVARRGIFSTWQNSDKLQMGEKYTGMRVPAGRKHAKTHWIAAWAHLYYWMVQQKLAKTLLEQQYEKEHGRAPVIGKEPRDVEGGRL